MNRIPPAHPGRRTIRLALALVPLLLVAADWPQFRGPGSAGTAADRGLPVSWSAQENVAWQQPLPGPGASSAVVWGDRVLVTAYSGYGLSEENPGDMRQLRLHVLCFDRSTGRPLWQREVEPTLPEGRFEGFVALHGYASSTPATDGERVYVFFGRSGVMAFDLEGNLEWRTSVGSGTHGWGSATSPLVVGERLLVNASVESGNLVALDCATGAILWQTGGMDSSWSTPVLVELDDAPAEVAVSVKGAILAIDPADGQVLWRADAIADYICPSLVAHEGIVYATGGRRGTTLAVRAGGRGNVTASHRLWETNSGSNVPSPVVTDGRLYLVSDSGIAIAVDTATGKTIYKKRLPGAGKVYASVVAADDKLYAVTRESGTFVLAAGDRFEILAQNSLAPDSSVFNASPAVADGRLLLRSDRFLYSLGAAGGASR